MIQTWLWLLLGPLFSSSMCVRFGTEWENKTIKNYSFDRKIVAKGGKVGWKERNWMMTIKKYHPLRLFRKVRWNLSQEKSWWPWRNWIYDGLEIDWLPEKMAFHLDQDVYWCCTLELLSRLWGMVLWWNRSQIYWCYLTSALLGNW